NDIGTQVKITSAGLTTYQAGLRTSLLNGTGHRFYREGSSIGHIGASNWKGDKSYRGLRFGLEPNADYMSWGFRKWSSHDTYTTMFSWHKTGNKSRKGFSFSDDANFLYDVNL